ncbi:MAG TPA: BTAD domain-containing putative transcriptional regulator, partial [bacterium]|nr:BTAD domain-containing putative transcriptional regulator [bacterium]
MAAERLEIRLLGELEILRDGKVLPLPASKKTRALAGYLAATRAPVSRDRLCELLWDTPDDPRAALRWSLTKIRPLVDAGKTTRLVAERDRVAIDTKGARVDWLAAQEIDPAHLESASLEALRESAALFRGELLEGLDLPDCFGWYEWLRGEREAARTRRMAVLSVLVKRLAADPAAALPYARARVGLDPLDEAAHIDVLRLYGALGRTAEAEAQYQSLKRLLAADLDAKPSAAVE